MKNYEIMIIVKATLSEDETKKVIDNFGKVLTDNGAKIVSTKDMGQRELAYEIKKSNSGIGSSIPDGWHVCSTGTGSRNIK